MRDLPTSPLYGGNSPFLTPEHCKELAARWGRSPPPIHMRHLKTKPAKEFIIRRAYGGREKIRGAVSEPDPMGKSPKRTTGAACGNCPHHHFVETTLHSRYQNSCATPEGNHQQRKLLRGLTPTTETAGSCGAPGHREASVPGGGCPFPGREHVPGAWERPTLPSARVWSP